ncbi:MAG: sulfatase-like hydrolase/transferase, partial [Isosphaeraceae bacterium]
MRAFLGLFALAVLLGVGPADPPKRLNVLFLMSDDMRPDLGCYGHPLAHSPNIDALARAGVRFDRAYCQYPLCNPSRSSLLTGRHPTTTGVLDNVAYFRDAHPDWVTLPEHFKANGYVTLRTGKIFHGGIDDAASWTEGADFPGDPAAAKAKRQAKKADPRTRKAQSDRIVVLDGDGESHGDYKTADRAIAFLRAHKDRPFFLACGFTKPHSPPTAPRKHFDLY